ncbi:MAG: helix-turn-helix transcriptional regulator [Clostridia bacterium]|nr:helix-turn-helix transcriptional regulator [Clostridia bacterium]
MELRLKEIRIQYGFTKKEIADIIGVSIIKYFLYENKLLKINANELITLSQHFNISIDYVIGLSDECKPLYGEDNLS